jgi:hypothetical protein
MKTLSPDLARALAQIANTVADLWDLYARLAVAIAGPLDVADVAEAARAAAAELAPLRDRLAAIVAALPSPSTDPPIEEDLELRPLELSRASVECVLADRLEPAIAALTAIEPPWSSLEHARADLECLLADRLVPAINGLSTALLVVHEEGPDRGYIL